MNNNRKEQRHEIIDPCRKYLSFTVTQEQGPVTAVIGNFSRNGILFECSRPFTVGDRAECSLRVNTATPREITFGIEVRYCYENKGAFTTGASIHAISKDKWFDAFEKLFDIIVTRRTDRDKKAGADPDKNHRTGMQKTRGYPGTYREPIG